MVHPLQQKILDSRLGMISLSISLLGSLLANVDFLILNSVNIFLSFSFCVRE